MALATSVVNSPAKLAFASLPIALLAAWLRLPCGCRAASHSFFAQKGTGLDRARRVPLAFTAPGPSSLPPVPVRLHPPCE